MWTRTMRTISLLLLLIWLVPVREARAQGPTPTAIVVSSCGGQALTVGAPAYLTVDSTGKACMGASSSGITVTTEICSGSTCYTSPVAVGATVVSSGSTSTIFGQTTGLTGGHCNNQSGANANLTITDGNNAYVFGPNFVVPFGTLDFPPGLIGQIMTGGLKMSASVSNAIVCWVTGKQ